MIHVAMKQHHQPVVGRMQPWRRAVAFVAVLMLPVLVQADPVGGCSSLPTADAVSGGVVTLEICAGNHQQTPVGTPFGEPLAVRLTASPGPTSSQGVVPAGSVLPNVGIRFQVIPGSSGAGAHPADIEINTDANGIASLLLTANGIPGAFEVEAQAQGIGIPLTTVRFSLTNTGTGTPTTTQAVPALSLPALLAFVLGLALLLARHLRS